MMSVEQWEAHWAVNEFLIDVPTWSASAPFTTTADVALKFRTLKAASVASAQPSLTWTALATTRGGEGIWADPQWNLYCTVGCVLFVANTASLRLLRLVRGSGSRNDAVWSPSAPLAV